MLRFFFLSFICLCFFSLAWGQDHSLSKKKGLDFYGPILFPGGMITAKVNLQGFHLEIESIQLPKECQKDIDFFTKIALLLLRNKKGKNSWDWKSYVERCGYLLGNLEGHSRALLGLPSLINKKDLRMYLRRYSFDEDWMQKILSIYEKKEALRRKERFVDLFNKIIVATMEKTQKDPEDQAGQDSIGDL